MTSPALESKPQCSQQDDKPCRNARGWRRIVRNFTPSWFAVNMGTGIVSILLHNLPYNGLWLQRISYVIFALNVLLFVVFLAISILRYTIFPEIWTVMIRHPAQSLFLGTFPMGLATIINMIVFVCVEEWGGNWWKLAWALWWFDAAVSLATCLTLPFIIMSKHDARLDTITAAWLLPIVAPIVAAASGGVVAEVIPHPEQALITVIVSYVLWGTGVPLAVCVLAIYLLRLTTCNCPPKEVIVSTFLPLGPLGQGGFAVMQLGKVALSLFPETQTLPETGPLLAGKILYTCGFLTAIIMWGFGLVWLFIAVASIATTPKFPFNMGWWGFTFPLGVYTVSTVTLGDEIPSAFFRILGTALSVAITLKWLTVSFGTIRGVWKGMLIAPCLQNLKQPEEEADEEKAESKVNGQT